jgi:hypothetical protein
MEEEYKLIPMSDITDEARKLAVAWMECEDKNWIGQKHKLASDIMNYAIKYHKQNLPQPREVTDEEIMPSIEAIWLIAKEKKLFEFKEWLSPYMKELEKYTEK